MRKIGLVILGILIGVGAILGYQRLALPTRADPSQDNLQTARVQKGAIVATVFSVGNVVPGRDLQLTFATVGRVKEVNVDVGDFVEAGQILARLDTVDLEWEMANADLNLAIRQAELAWLQAGPGEAALASAKANLVAAQKVLTSTLAGSAPEEIKAARSALASAQANYDLLLSQPKPEAIRQAELQVEFAKNGLWQAQNQRDIACNIETKSRALCDAHEAVVGNGHVQIQMAELALAEAQKPVGEAELQSALAQVQLAQANLDKLLIGPDIAAVAAAEAQVAQAQAQLDQLTTGTSPEEIRIAEARVQQAQLTRQQAQRKLADTTLVAPFSGIVTSVNYRSGDIARLEGPGIGLADLAQLQIQVSVAEVDIGQVQVGQKAEVILDALPDQVISGQVTSIAPAARSEQGVVNYPVTITISDEHSTGEASSTIKPGMTGNVSIVIGQREGVLLVPNRAIRRSQGRHLVTVLRGDRLIETPVRIGLSGETATEVIDGLRQGDLVLLNQTSAQSGLSGGLFQDRGQ